MLAAYLKQTRRLLQLPGTQSTSLYTDADLTDFINISRGQIAGEGECIRVMATIPTVAKQQALPLPGFNFGVPATTGVQGIINDPQHQLPGRHRRVVDDAAPVAVVLAVRTATTPVPQPGPPTVWSQFGQGAAPSGVANTSINGGSFYVSPIPDDVYTLNLNSASATRIPLALDTDVEALPYFWTDCGAVLCGLFCADVGADQRAHGGRRQHVQGALRRVHGSRAQAVQPGREQLACIRSAETRRRGRRWGSRRAVGNERQRSRNFTSSRPSAFCASRSRISKTRRTCWSTSTLPAARSPAAPNAFAA